MKKSYIKTILLAIAMIVLAIAIVLFPKDVLAASTRGLNIWWGVVFPSLLPFLVVGDLLRAFGVVSFFGVLLEPIMRPVFKVPGVGGFVLALGMASGFPAGAKMAAQLRKEQMLSRTEAERLVTFTNASNPLFIFGAVSVGFFHRPDLGILIALAHYGGNLLIGFLMRFYKGKEKPAKLLRTVSLLRTGFRAMHNARLRETRPFGKIFGDAVISAIQTLLMIGGFIIVFSVVNRLLFVTGAIQLVVAGMREIFSTLTIPHHLIPPWIAGIFEMTLGTQLTSQASVTLLQAVIMVSFILGFSGFSIHAQVASILAETDIRYRPFFFAKILHGFLSAIISYFLFQQQKWTTDVYQIIQFTKPMLFFTTYGPALTLTCLFVYLAMLLRRMREPVR